MNPHFREVIETLHPALESLLAMPPVTTLTLPRRMPESGIYLFTERGSHLYVGRSNRLRSRIRNHGGPSAGENVASFAFRIARTDTGNITASYQVHGSRKDLLMDPTFLAAFNTAKTRVQRMEVRFVEERNQLKQAVLEIYAAVALGTTFNDFDTH